MSKQLLQHLARLIADDGHACTFQSLGQYRKALLEAVAQASAAPQQQPAAQDVAALMREHRIAVTPEHEGQWHADLYGHEAEPIARAEGDTPEQAVSAVVAAYRSGSPEGQNLPQQEGDQ